MYHYMAILAIFVFIYSIVAGKLELTPIAGPIVFTAFGLLMGFVDLGLEPVSVTSEGIRLLAELTLALVLFTDAAISDLAELRRSFRIPERLLAFGLPLTIGLGILAGMLVFDGLTLIEVAVLATLLAPTDAALGKPVVTQPAVPGNIRDGLSLESGLNDGICVPILFIFLALASETGEPTSVSLLAVKLVLEQIGIGLLVGLGLTFLASLAIRFCSGRGMIGETWEQIPVVALAVACFSLAQITGGSGFIACFTGGLLFGALTRRHKHRLLLAAEGSGDTIALITWIIFGYAVIAKVYPMFTWTSTLYAVLSLTVVRMLPAFLVLSGLGLSTAEKLFVGWFGPRGLASVVFTVIILDYDLPGARVIAITAIITILLSIIGHGMTAMPLISRLFGRKGEGAGMGLAQGDEVSQG